MPYMTTDSTVASKVSSKKSRRRGKQKKNKKASQTNVSQANFSLDSDSKEIEIEYVLEKAEFGINDQFCNVFNKFFNSPEPLVSEEKEDVKEKVDLDEEEEVKEIISNKKKKRNQRMNIAELKNLSTRPDVVEMWDVTSADPKLLVFLKSYRNTVPVPRHWSQKKKFLDGKRGIMKQPLRLPDFIADTGIEKLRQAYNEKEGSKKLKRKQRDRMQPKMGKMEIDYQVLHDAFFKYQTKPKMTVLGELYFEGKEFEVKRPNGIKIGTLSDKLKQVFGMEEGDSPPWLSRMQRYGPPPSYRDFFDTIKKQDEPRYEDECTDKSKHWGDLLEEEEEMDVEELEDGIEGDLVEEEDEDDIESIDTLSSTPIELRKEADRPLYEVLEEKGESIGLGTLLGTTHTYVIKTSSSQDKTGAKRVDLMKGRKRDCVEVSLKPEEVVAMDNVVPAKYEEAREEEKLRNKREDFSDMVADYNSEKKRKRHKADKKKDFKF